MNRWKILRGDVLSVLSGLPAGFFDAVLCDPPYGLAFMGKAWDHGVPNADTWREVLRVLRPGAHLMAFGGTRTFHRQVCAIEDAGFEIRDCLMRLPKSLDVSRAVEPRPPGTPPKTDAGKRWLGAGTALKPAWEPITLARKPLEGTVAANVTAHGTGALAIDACRLGESGGTAKGDPPKGASNGIYGNGINGACEVVDLGKGRWPANVAMDEEAGAMLDAEVGDRPGMSGGGKHRKDYAGGMFSAVDSTSTARGDSGGPSRFFYSAKVSTKEREAGCEALPLLSGGEMTDREDGSAGLESPRAGAGRGGGSRNRHPTLKPITLATWLAKMLCPPAGIGRPRVCLVPFSGAGSEMIGALLGGFDVVIGIELDQDEEGKEAGYIATAEARLAHWVR